MRVPCACKGLYLERFARPAILIVLSKKPLLGAAIYQEIHNSELLQKTILDRSGFYRLLKTLEKEGLISAEPSTRKVYKITKDGLNCLSDWERTLSDYADYIKTLARTAEHALEEVKHD